MFGWDEMNHHCGKAIHRSLQMYFPGKRNALYLIRAMVGSFGSFYFFAREPAILPGGWKEISENPFPFPSVTRK